MAAGCVGRQAVVLAAALWAASGWASGGGPRASELMKRGLYSDAARALLGELRGKPQEECGRQFLMLGECFYMLKEYGKARPYFVKANRYAKGQATRLISDYRLACVAYRLGDAAGALGRIEGFVRAHPAERRAGTLLLFKMKLLARRGPDARADLEAIQRQLERNRRTYGHAAVVAGDKILTDFYLAHGQAERARSRYISMVHNFRNVIAQYAREKRPVPESLRKAHDEAAMQLGLIALKSEKLEEATKWLENVQYAPELMRQARLVLAQVAYQKRDFDRAIWTLTREGFVETVPAGPLRSDMRLLLGLAEKSKPNPNLKKAVEWLKKVEKDTKGYYQAQVVLGDLYRERGLTDYAVSAYERALPSPKYEACVLFHLGTLYLGKAEETKDKRAAEALCRKAAECLSKLTTRYPSSQLTREASPAIDKLLGKGYQVTVATSDAEMARRWEALARSRPGSPEAARALINLARLHQKAVMDEKGARFVKAPNHAACLKACDRLLDPKTYKGEGLPEEAWRGIRAEALYYRGMCHLASATRTGRKPKGAVSPVYVRKADLGTAIAALEAARELVEPKRLDMVKNIELGLLEALFKSEKPEDRKRAEARFKELVDEYGTDARFQRLAMELAEWYREKGRYEEAARQYQGVAERGGNLPQDERLKVLYLAGQLYSKAACEAQENPGKRTYGILVYPKEVIRLPGLLKTYRPFQKKVRIRWPSKSRQISAEQALTLVSEASGIPFVWSRRSGRESVAEYMKRHKVAFRSLSGTVEDFLRQILDPQHHGLAFDIGLTGNTPTLAPRGSEEPEETGRVRVIEIYEKRAAFQRYRPLARPYGPWRAVHRDGAMLYHVAEHIEKVTGTKLLWADGVDKDGALAAEFREPPGLDASRSHPCGQVLAAVLGARDLRFKIVARNRSAELFEAAKECFNRIRQSDPRSRYGEKALFLAALNYYRQEDYERMQLVLKEYLKLFDSPACEHHHEACFWVGWVFERERRYREACRYYARAAEERLVLYKPGTQDHKPSRNELGAALSYDSRFALEEPVSGELKGMALDPDFLDYVRMNSNAALRLDASATGIETPIEHAPFKDKPLFGVLCDVLDALGLSFRVENVRPEVAERALYRMAVCYKKDELMEQALSACSALLSRYPRTRRRRDAYKLKLDVYKGLKDYRNVLATLEELRTELRDEIEPYKIDFEVAWVYLDLCRYEEAIARFKAALAAAKEPGERLRIRDGYARGLFRAGSLPEALNQFHTLAKEEPEDLRRFIDEMMVWYLELATGKSVLAALPTTASKLIRAYEALGEGQRARLPNDIVARVTWVYYLAGLLDLRRGSPERALDKLSAAANSPDDWLAADALYRAALLHMKAERLKEAADTLEYLLFSTKSAEAEVKATYALAQCLEKLGKIELARKRYDHLVRRFPDSPYAERARAHLGPPRRKPKTAGN